MQIQMQSKRSRAWRQVKRRWMLLAMISLPVLYYALFCYKPMYGILISFFDYKPRLGFSGSKFVGLQYFREYLSDPYFWKLVRNTLLLNVWNLALGFPAPILLALLLNEIRSIRYKRVIQTVSYLPHFISTVVVCGMINNFFANSGIVNNVIMALGGERIQFMMKSEYFRSIFIGSEIWQTAGWGSIIYIAALSGVDVQLYEAARIDGAGRWKQAVHITLPCIVPTIMIMLILRIGNMMTVGYQKIILLYNGATYETADVINTYVYRRSFTDGKYSYSTAVGLFSSVINMIFIWSANAFSRKFSESSLW